MFHCVNVKVCKPITASGFSHHLPSYINAISEIESPSGLKSKRVESTLFGLKRYDVNLTVLDINLL